uniref:Uncharacterized protein n=1 Tax=Fagus sylvatica TaxID=28930 RepID=A0A2N9IQZ0_FAGSY
MTTSPKLTHLHTEKRAPMATTIQLINCWTEFGFNPDEKRAPKAPSAARHCSICDARRSLPLAQPVVEVISMDNGVVHYSVEFYSDDDLKD